MKLGIIDIGTNSIRFAVYRLHHTATSGATELLHREKRMVRLGNGVFLHGRLDFRAKTRTLQTLQDFRKTADLYGLHHLVVYGTSALREASDAAEFVRKVKRQTGIDVRVISGAEEARLIAKGILASQSNPGTKHFALVDIGGGSTEISLCKGKKVVHSVSIPLGSARLDQIFFQSTGKSATARLDALDRLRQYATSTLRRRLAKNLPRGSSLKVLGSSGTVKAVARLMKHNEGTKKIQLPVLQKWIRIMAPLSATRLKQIAGIELQRADILLPGAVLLEQCMLALGATEVQAVEAAMREGILQDELELFLKARHSHVSLHINEFKEKARRLGCEMSHILKVRDIAETLFDRLKSLHRLNDEWKFYLIAAALLHDTGKSISPVHHELHSAYVVKNANFPLAAWEIDFIARLCLQHAKDNPLGKGTNPFDIKGRNRKAAFRKLLSLLRLADGLGRGAETLFTLRALRLSRRQVTLSLKLKRRGHDDFVHLRGKQMLFKKVFDKNFNVIVR